MNLGIVGPILFYLFAQFAIPVIDSNTVKLNTLASEQISLEKRYDNKFVSDIFKDNILLNIAYLDGKVTGKDQVNWSEIEKPFSYKFTLLPNQAFAFHDDVLPQYNATVVKTTNAHFNYEDGFKSDGYLTGDGVCHLASLMYWVAKNAGLDAYAPTNHNFAVIPEISKEYGVSIYRGLENSSSNELQNLYIANNRKNAVTFEFDYKDGKLKLSIFEETKNSI